MLADAPASVFNAFFGGSFFLTILFSDRARDCEPGSARPGLRLPRFCEKTLRATRANVCCYHVLFAVAVAIVVFFSLCCCHVLVAVAVVVVDIVVVILLRVGVVAVGGGGACVVPTPRPALEKTNPTPRSRENEPDSPHSKKEPPEAGLTINPNRNELTQTRAPSSRIRRA